MAGHECILQLVEEAEGAAPEEEVGRLECEGGGDVSARAARHEVVCDEAS